MNLTFHTLPNGIRMVHRQTASEVAHCGIIINAGSRDELPRRTPAQPTSSNICSSREQHTGSHTIYSAAWKTWEAN
ncbi:MAG: hypothetical protein U5L72_07415 [Bacteroidales bacterium]|nr:hypothetical protein [Bacteroidales bacterium]